MDSQENLGHLLVSEGQLVTYTLVWVVFTHNALSCSPLPTFGPLKVQKHEGGKKRCKISNLHYRACSDSLPTMCVFCARALARLYVCMWAKDMFSLAMIQCLGRQIKSCLKASPVRSVTWRDNAVNAMSSCHWAPLPCRQTRSSTPKMNQ